MPEWIAAPVVGILVAGVGEILVIGERIGGAWFILIFEEFWFRALFPFGETGGALSFSGFSHDRSLCNRCSGLRRAQPRRLRPLGDRASSPSIGGDAFPARTDRLGSGIPIATFSRDYATFLPIGSLPRRRIVESATNTLSGT